MGVPIGNTGKPELKDAITPFLNSKLNLYASAPRWFVPPMQKEKARAPQERRPTNV